LSNGLGLDEWTTKTVQVDLKTYYNNEDWDSMAKLLKRLNTPVQTSTALSQIEFNTTGQKVNGDNGSISCDILQTRDAFV
jgi:hypothetical protein